MKKRYIYDKQEKLASAMSIGEASRNVEFKESEGTLTPTEREMWYGSNTYTAQQTVPYLAQTQNGINPQLYMNQIMRQVDLTLNSSCNPDTYKIVFERQTDYGIYAYILDRQAWIYYERRETVRDQNNLHGGIAHTGKIKDKGIEVCKTIFFLGVNSFKREDMPGKHFYDVAYCYDAAYVYDVANEFKTDFKKHVDVHHVVVEYEDLKSKDLCDKISASVVKPGKSKICSMLFRSEILRLADNNIEITIPTYPGWYCDERYGWVYLHRGIYDTLEDYQLPPAMIRRSIVPTERTVNMVFSEIEKIINVDSSLSILFALSCIPPFQSLLKQHGIVALQIIAPIITDTVQAKSVAAIFKTNDILSLDVTSLDQNFNEVKQELAAACDGCAVIQGPMTAKEAKINDKTARIIRDVTIGANGTEIPSHCMISLPCRFVPEAISKEYILRIDCSGMPINIDNNQLRLKVLEFQAALISYIESNYDKVEGIVRDTINEDKGKHIKDISYEKENLYLMQIVVSKVMYECFKIYLFNNATIKIFNQHFGEEASSELSPNYVVRDQFFDATYKLIRNGKFIITELKDAHKQYSEDGIVLILDRKKGFLNFPKEALDMIAQMLSAVKDGDELAAILKACNSIYCTDNGARQITISGKRSAFYSVFLSEFDDDITDIIDFCENEEFFFDPNKVPRNFVPVIWHNGLCAGFVLDGKGLSNPHINISGLSGMGKNRGAYKTSEGYWRLRAKVIFLDVKGGGTEESLMDMKCDVSKYEIINLKTDGFPFPIFDLSAFSGKNAKVNYVTNVIGASVGLTELQMNELSDYADNLICNETINFSLLELIESIPSKKSVKLKNKLQPLLNIMQAYEPKDGKYKYSTCSEFVKDSSKITVLSIAQGSNSVLHATVYSMLQAIFEHRIIDSSKRLVIYADEIQKYTADSPFKKLYAEAREFKTCMVAMTQEYRAPGDESKEMTSNAAMELFYPPTNDSEGRVSRKIGKKYGPDEHHQKGVGFLWAKGYFWSRIDKCHKFVTLTGMNDDNKFSELQSYPENYYGTGY